MADLSVEDLEKAIKDILKGADLSNLSTKKVRKMLEEKFDADFISRKKEIDKLVMKHVTESEEAEEEEKEEEKKEDPTNGVSDGSDSDEEKSKKTASKPAPSKPPAKPSKRKSAGKADDSEDPVMSSIKQMDDEDLAKRLQEEESGLRTRGSRRAAAAPPKPKKKRKEQDPDKKKTSVYNRPCRLSDDLAAVVGTNEMPRPEVVKTLWTLVKERNLQDPENKQFIICDEQLHKLFGVQRLKAFGMMKFLKSHIWNMDQ